MGGTHVAVFCRTSIQSVHSKQNDDVPRSRAEKHSIHSAAKQLSIVSMSQCMEDREIITNAMSAQAMSAYHAANGWKTDRYGSVLLSIPCTRRPL